MPTTKARQEWADFWYLPFVAMLGVSGATLLPYISGLLIEPLTESFGWTRSEFSFAFMLQVVLGLVSAPIAGRLIDQHGPRKLLLIGIPCASFGLSLLSLVGHAIWTWWLLVVLQGLAAALILPVGWISAVIGQFHAARGLALAIALAGVGLGAAIWPVLGAFTIAEVGWRAALPILGIGWGAIVFPLAFFLLPESRHEGVTQRRSHALPSNLRQILLSKQFVLLTTAGSLFIVINYGYNLHFVPILKDIGYSTTGAAGVASLAGIFAIAGRIGTGLLLDIVPTKPLGATVFLVPIAVAALLLNAAGEGWMPILAVIMLGLALGAETDIIAYIASREFPEDLFASAFAVISAVFGLCSGFGPLFASLLYDASGSYTLFMLASGAIAIVGSACICLIPIARRRSAHLETQTSFCANDNKTPATSE